MIPGPEASILRGAQSTRHVRPLLSSSSVAARVATTSSPPPMHRHNIGCYTPTLSGQVPRPAEKTLAKHADEVNG